MPVDVIGESDKGAFGAENVEQPMPLDDEGLIYYVRFRSAGKTDEPHATPEEAMLAAESKTLIRHRLGLVARRRENISVVSLK